MSKCVTLLRWILLVAPLILHESVEAVSSKDRDRVILAFKQASDRCKGVKPDSHPSEIEAGDWSCAKAFEALDDIGKNSCRNCRNPKCRLLKGSEHCQCSCTISTVDFLDRKNQVTKTFQECAAEVLPANKSPENLLPSAGFRDKFKQSDETLEASRLLPDLPDSLGSLSLAEDDDETKELKCKFCPATFLLMSALQQHMKTHAFFKCRFCKGVRFSSRVEWMNHTRREHPGKYTGIVGEASTSRGSKRKFSFEPFEFRCCLCPRQYASRDALESHINRVHFGKEAAAWGNDPNVTRKSG